MPPSCFLQRGRGSSGSAEAVRAALTRLPSRRPRRARLAGEVAPYAPGPAVRQPFLHAVQLKLNEIVAALEGASNRLIDVEDLDEEELQTLRSHFQKLSQMAKRDSRLTASHSIEEAESRHRSKQRLRRGGSKSPANRTPRAS